MNNIMDHLAQIEKSEAYKILSEAAAKQIEINIKAEDSERVFSSKIEKNQVRRFFYIQNKNLVFDENLDVTIKISLNNRLFFLKTVIKKATQGYYFTDLENLFELVRRKKPRFGIPERWTQICYLHATNHPIEFRAKVKILNISKIGVRIKVEPDLPKYELNQIVNFFFKIHRRAEILVKSKIIYVKPSKVGGPILGLEFSDNSILINNKIQNVLDDLAFYYAHLDD